jgi:uncharacterized protein (PEP-CTERM system associated)
VAALWLGALAPGALLAAESYGQRALVIQPNASVTQTFTDNYLLSGAAKSSDSISRLAVGVNLTGQTGLMQGHLEYTLSGSIYARHHDRNTTENALNASLSAELIENRAKVDASATMGRSAISAFGVQPSSGGLRNSNVTELRTVQVKPSFHGPLGAGLVYTAVLGLTATDAADTQIGDTVSSMASLHLGPASPGLITWSLDASHTKSDFKVGRLTEDNRVFGSLSSRLDALDLEVHANAGGEQTNMSSLRRETYRNWGGGMVWAPSPRTRVAADVDERFYGKSHSVSAEYRTPLTVWQWRDSRSLSTGTGQSSGGQSTAFDLFFAQFASVEPDPVKRAELARAFLQSRGIDPGTTISTGSLNSAVTVQDQQSFSLAVQGVRDVLTVSATRGKTRRLDPIVGTPGDLANTDSITVRGLSLDLAHRLTTDASISLNLNSQQGHGELATQSNRQRQLGLNFTMRLTAQSSMALGWRRALYENASTVPFDETAFFATFGLRF